MIEQNKNMNTAPAEDAIPLNKNSNTQPYRHTARHELVELAFTHGGSTRLCNSLLAAQVEGILDGLSISAITSNDQNAANVLMRIPNFGVKCMAELQALVQRDIHRPIKDTSTTLALPTGLFTDAIHGVNANARDTIEIRISTAIEALHHIKPSAQQVLRARLGLDGANPMILESVGKTMGLTRERVRQIEASAYRKLRTMFGQTFRNMISAQQTDNLQRWAVNHVIPDTDETTLFQTLSPDMRLLIRVEFKTVQAWLETVTTRIQNGWLLPEISLSEYRRTCDWLTSRLEHVELPYPVSELLLPDSPPIGTVKAALQLSPRVRVVENYLVPARSTRRARRAVRVHKLLLRKPLAQPTSLYALKENYRRINADDQCSARDILVILLDNPHLFLNQYEVGWLPIGNTDTTNTTLLSSDTSSTNVLAETFSNDENENIEDDIETLKGVLSQILLDEGPQSFNDLRRHFVRRVGKKYSKSSVGPILISTDEFVRIGPGIYAHRRQIQDQKLLSEAADRLLLNKTQCEIFCRAIWAGESTQTYLLWTSEMQVKWAEWCHCTKQRDLLSSLLAVCAVDVWPIKAGDKERWARLKEQLSAYLLEESPTQLVERLPTFREFLSASAWAVSNGNLSWMGINRVTGYRVDDRHSASLLSLLVAAGIVEPAMHWQQQHQTSCNAAPILKKLLSQTNPLEPNRWPTMAIRSVRASYNAILEPGWIANEDVESVLDKLNQKVLREGLVGQDVQINTEPDRYNELKRKLRDDILFNSMRLRITRSNSTCEDS